MVFDFSALTAAEEGFSLFLQGFASPELTLLMRGVTFLGNPIFWLLLATFVYWKGEEAHAAFIVNLMLLAGLFVGLLKPIFGRLRPPAETLQILTEDIYLEYSFPSGHATAAGSVFGYGYWILRNHWLTALALAMMLAVGLSRVYLGVHYLSDVIVGWVLGFFVGSLNFSLLKNIRVGKLKITLE